MEPTLSIILPLRAGRSTAYLVDRLARTLDLMLAHAGVECVVVDSASAPRFRAAIERVCARAGCRRVVDPRPQHPFAPGQVRNLGVAHARGRYVLLFDLDLRCSPNVVERVLRWARGRHDDCEFLLVPCLYLTRIATARVDAQGAEPPVFAELLGDFLAGDNRWVSRVALGTSTVVVRRAHFLRVGGYRAEFVGHGAEDFELLHRLASFWPRGERASDYYVDAKRLFVADYVGFRAYLVPYALDALLSGLFTVHLWHARPVWPAYWRRGRKNDRLLRAFMELHDHGRVPAEPLADASGAAAGETLTALPVPWSRQLEPRLALAEVLSAAMRAHDLDRARHPGLFAWRPGVVDPDRRRAKWRKLLLRPREFFADAKLPGSRLLSRLFPR